MNKIIKGFLFLFIGGTAFFQSCNKVEIPVFEGDNFIQFSRPLSDSLTCSFLDAPDTTHKYFPIGLQLIGRPSASDRTFSMRIVGENTTAGSNHYELPSTFTFKANAVKDTIWIKVNNTADIKQKAVKISYQLQESSDFKIGEPIYSAGIVYFSNKISQPVWWRGTIQSSYLGTYSDKKYSLFIELTKIIDLDPNNLLDVMEKTLILKNYLLKKKDANEPVLEADGTEMKVALTVA